MKVYLLCAVAAVAYVLLSVQLPQDLGTGIATVVVVALLGGTGLAGVAFKRRQRVS